MQINIYKDKMLGARLFGASVLYSARPIPREDVPLGWYCYDLRGTAHHPDEPHALVDCAEENHAGSILSYLPLKNGRSQYRLVKDMFQMTGTNPSLAEFCAAEHIRCPETPLRHMLCPASPEDAGLFYAQTPERDEELGSIRNLPFGYCIKNGKTCVEENAADTVRMIFRQYIQGASYQKLANVLEQDKIPYIAGKRWNKNIIARILKDIRYTGDEEYPPIIAQDMFQSAAESNEWSCASPERVKFIKNMRALVRCPLCGGTIFRNIRANWRCPDCMDTSVKVTDDALERSAAELLKQLGGTAPNMEIPDASSEMETVQGLEDELLQALDQAEFDEAAAKGWAMALASARFDALGSEDYETMRIQYILTRAEQNGGLDTELLRQITSAILIHPDGAVSLKLKNGQIIEKE